MNKPFPKEEIRRYIEGMSGEERFLFRPIELKRIIERYKEEMNEDQIARLLDLYGTKLHTEDTLNFYIRNLLSIQNRMMSETIANRIIEKFKDSFIDMETNDLIDLLRVFLANLSVVPINEIEDAITIKLQYEPRERLFSILKELGYISDRILYDLMLYDDFWSYFQVYEKEDLYKFLKTNRIYLNPKLTAYFGDILNESVDINESIEIGEFVEERFLETKSLKYLLQFYVSIKMYDDFEFRRINVEKIIKKKLEDTCHSYRELINVLDLLLMADEIDFSFIIFEKLTETLSKTKSPAFEFTNKVDYLTEICFVYSHIFSSLGRITKPKVFSFSSNQKLIEALDDCIFHLILDALFEEKMGENLFTMEEIAFYKSKASEPEYKVKEYNYQRRHYEAFLDFYQSLVDNNIGTSNLIWKLNEFFAQNVLKLDKDLWLRFLSLYNQTNHFNTENNKNILESIKQLEAIEEVSLKDSLQLFTQIAKFLILSHNNFQNDWKILNKLPLHEQTINDLDIEDKRDLYLIQLNLQQMGKPYLNNIQIHLPDDYVVNPSIPISDDLDFYFKYLFYQNLQKNNSIERININFSQQSKALLIFDKRDMVGRTDVPSGTIELILIFLSSRYSTVDYLGEYYFQTRRRRNDRMHYLRVATKGWKVDTDSRNEFYEKPYEDIEDIIARLNQEEALNNSESD